MNPNEIFCEREWEKAWIESIEQNGAKEGREGRTRNSV